MTARRVAITGLGVVAPIGNSVNELLTNLAEGRSGVQRLPAALACRLRSPIAATVDFEDVGHSDAPRLRMLDRVSRLALAAADRAIADARFDFARERRDRCGVFVGSSLGGAADVRRVARVGGIAHACERGRRRSGRLMPAVFA